MTPGYSLKEDERRAVAMPKPEIVWRTSTKTDSPYHKMPYGELSPQQQDIHSAYSLGQMRVQSNIPQTDVKEEDTIEFLANEILARRKGEKPVGLVRVLQV